MKRYYSIAKPSSVVDDLTPEMIRQPGKGPKLRSKGSECRGLVPLGFELAIAMKEKHQSEHTNTIVRMMSALLFFYQAIDQEEYPIDTAAKMCRSCCLHYKALRDEARVLHGHSTKLWTLSPKFHMWIEVTEYQAPHLGCPRTFWCYRDEAFVGYVSKLAFSRGGANVCATASMRLLTKVRAMIGLANG